MNREALSQALLGHHIAQSSGASGAAASRALLEINFEQVALGEYKRCRGPDPGGVDVPRLRSVRQWRSSKARQAESVTLVTQLSLER